MREGPDREFLVLDNYSRMRFLESALRGRVSRRKTRWNRSFEPSSLFFLRCYRKPASAARVWARSTAMRERGLLISSRGLERLVVDLARRGLRQALVEHELVGHHVDRKVLGAEL